MKNISTIISILLTLSLANILSCSSQSDSLKQNDSGATFVTGQILMAQNEPFAKLALVADSTVYLLNYPDEMKEPLMKNQGKIARVYYKSISKNTDSVNVLNVDKVEILNSKD
jgi:hypothetical protein